MDSESEETTRFSFVIFFNSSLLLNQGETTCFDSGTAPIKFGAVAGE